MPYDFTSYKHDVENFISDLAKLAAIRENEKNNTEKLYARLQAINSISLGLSAKTSFLRYMEILESDSDVILETRRHSLTRAIERVCYAARQLNYLHHGRAVLRPVNIERATFGEFKGPDFFEFIPFAIIDNAVKYKLRDGNIDVSIYEVGTDGYVDFTSIGPVILDDERESIFSEGTRGQFAIKAGRGGSGIGLFHARQAMRASFNGDIELVRSDSSQRFSVDGVLYDHHTFRLRLPFVS